MDAKPCKLGDEQMRRFICDGLLVLDSGLASSLHRRIRDKLDWANSQDSNLMGNVLPRVPELQQVLDAPAVRGALQSVLGDGYAPHPMRALVPSEPLPPQERGLLLRGSEEGTPLGEGSRSYTYWHKDTYMPLGRARYHRPRCAFLLYFPQDTPVKRGPTRVIPGSQYHDHITPADHAYAHVPDQLRAGSCILMAYDIEHAGLSNLTDETRHMAKFAFLRTRNPRGPSWNGGKAAWQAPNAQLGRYAHPETWVAIWDWLRGHRAPGKAAAKMDMDLHLANLNVEDQEKRLAAIYSLGALGKSAVEPLVTSLLALEGKNRIEPPYVQKADGSFEMRGDPHERRWTEGGYIFQDEAFALGCLGSCAVDALVKLLDSPDPWICCNAAFALGEVGSPAGRSVPRLAALLDSRDHRVVRAALEAIACIGVNTEAALPAIRKLLATPRDFWAQDIKLEHLVGDQIHFNAVNVLLLSEDLDLGKVEDLLIQLLETPAPNISVPALALELLLRHGSAKSNRHALAYLQARAWDDTLWPGNYG